MNARLLLVATIGKLPRQVPDAVAQRLRQLASWTPPDVTGGVLMFGLELAHELAPEEGRRTWCGNILGTMNLAADEADQLERAKQHMTWTKDKAAGCPAIALWQAWADEAERIPEERVHAARLRNEIAAMLGKPLT